MYIPKMIQALAQSVLLLSSLAGTAFARYYNTTAEFFTTLDGTSYAYHFHPAHGSNATFLLLHGYPSSHKDWGQQVAALTAAGFGTLAPDMLGFGESDMPAEVEAYNGKRLASHLAELLDHTGLETVIGVGHDWGAGILTQLAVHQQARFEKFVFVNVGYTAPGGFIDLDAMNARGLSTYGYMPFGYWYFFDRYDAGTVIRNHVSVF
jgi:pimeloyl-ACP methyl ester carboxylesterase